METNPEERFKEFVELALREGAVAARIIPASGVAVDERVRLKCAVPFCGGYNRYLTCPPHTLSVEDFTRALSRYHWCLVVQVEAQDIGSSDKSTGRIDEGLLKEVRDLHGAYKLRLLEIVEKVETAAFKKGLRFATGLIGGSCILCEQCVEDKVSEPCRHPFRARPAMEGVGIDVFQTVENAGLAIHLSSSENVRWTGLILLE